MSTIREITSSGDGLDWLYGKFDSVSLFKGEMNITIYSDTEEAVSYAEKCVESFNRLTENKELIEEIREKLAGFMLYMRDEWKAMGIYEDIAEDTEKAVRAYEAGKDIFSFLKNPVLTVELPEEETDDIGYELNADCPWEPEHQCSVIIRENELKYVGPCEGNTPWDDDDEYYCIWLDEAQDRTEETL